MRIHRGKERFPPAAGSANRRICLRIGEQKQQKENTWGKRKMLTSSRIFRSLSHSLAAPLAAQFLFFFRKPRVGCTALLSAALSSLRSVFHRAGGAAENPGGWRGKRAAHTRFGWLANGFLSIDVLVNMVNKF